MGIFPAAPPIPVPVYNPNRPGIFDLRTFGNAVGDQTTDDTNAFLACIAAANAYSTKIGPQNLAGGGTIVVPPGTYRVTQPLPIQKHTLVCGYGPKVSSIVFGVSDGNGGYTYADDGFIYQSNFTQSHDQMWLENLAINSCGSEGVGGRYGVWAQGSSISGIRRCQIGGWGTCVRLEMPNLFTIDTCTLSSFGGVGVQDPVGVHFVLGVGGGATNLIRVLGTQFNGSRIGCLFSDATGVVVEDCNFNSNETPIQIEGVTNAVIQRCLAEAVRGNTYVRFGPSNGYVQGTIVAELCAIRDCSFSRNEPHVPDVWRLELNAQVRNLDLSGTQIFYAAPNAPPMQVADPQAQANTMVTQSLQRDRLLIGGNPATLRTVPAAITDLISKPLWGTDLGRQA